MKEIETYKTVIFSNRLDKNNSFSQNIYCDFQPDEVVLKYISINVRQTSDVEPMYLIKSDIIDHNILFTISGSTENTTAFSYSEIVNTPFLIKKPINGTYNFNILNYNGESPSNVSTTFNMYIAITLMFIKYKSH